MIGCTPQDHYSDWCTFGLGLDDFFVVEDGVCSLDKILTARGFVKVNTSTSSTQMYSRTLRTEK